MKKALLVFSFLISGTFLLAQVPSASKWETGGPEDEKRQVMLGMQKLRMALLNKDSVQLDAVLADDVTYGHSNGWNQSKSELIRSIMSGEQDYQKLQPEKMEIRLFGNTAVVNFESLVALKLRGEQMEMHLDILLVWVKMNNHWKLIARQSAKNS